MLNPSPVTVVSRFIPWSRRKDPTSLHCGAKIDVLLIPSKRGPSIQRHSERQIPPTTHSLHASEGRCWKFCRPAFWRWPSHRAGCSLTLLTASGDSQRWQFLCRGSPLCVAVRFTSGQNSPSDHRQLARRGEPRPRCGSCDGIA